MAWVCRDFGISRKTGYKIFKKYKEVAIDGIMDNPTPGGPVTLPPSPFFHRNTIQRSSITLWISD
jgi:hypothetical protein